MCECECECECDCEFGCVCVSKIHPQEPLQLEGSLYKLIQIVILELAPGFMSVYELISQSCGDS